jgi:hypothetical protein
MSFVVSWERGIKEEILDFECDSVILLITYNEHYSWSPNAV